MCDFVLGLAVGIFSGATVGIFIVGLLLAAGDRLNK